MVKKRVVDLKIDNIDKEIEKLENKKEKILTDSKMVYCPVCKKAYLSDQCRQGPIMSDGFLEEWEIICPKGHKWDGK
jgi:hypothetical protein